MAFHTGNTNNTTNQQSGQQSTQQTGQQAAAPQQPAQPGDFMSILNTLSGSGLVARGGGGEAFTNLREAMTLAARELIASELDAKFIALNRQEYQNLRFSVLILCVGVKSIPGHMAYHAMVLEATGEKLKNEMVTIDGRQTELIRVSSDAVDSRLIDMMYSVVSKNFPGVHCHYAAAQVVPASIHHANKDMVENIIRNSAMACVSQIYTQTDNFQRLSLATYPADSRLGIDVTDGVGQVYDATGNPHRASAMIDLSVLSTNKRSLMDQLTIVNDISNADKLCSVSGFINPTWVGERRIVGANGIPQVLPKLQAEFVATNVKTLYSTSVASVLLSMASLTSLFDGTWMQLLIPKGGRVSDEMNNIGMLNVICNAFGETDKGIYGSEVAIEKFEGDPVRISQYIAMLFREGLMLSLDCPEATSQSWYMNVFAQAAIGDRDAENMIIEAANELTGGNFAKHWKSGSSVISNSIRVPMGYYNATGRDGETIKRDIRDIDLTAICSIFSGSPDQIHQYCSTFVPRQGFSEQYLIAQRVGFITTALRNRCEITGMARRVTLSEAFIHAFGMGLGDLKLNTVITTPLSVDQMRQGVPAPEFISSAVVGNMKPFVNMGPVSSSGRMMGNTAVFGLGR